MADELAERWRKPITVLDVTEDGDTAVRYKDGESWYRGLRVTTDADGYHRIRGGRVCVQCLEPQELPFPEKCSLCQFEMRKLQRQVFEHEFGGDVKGGGSTTISDELERLDFWADEKRWQRTGVKGLLVPRKLRN